jgi:hypothetical protein
MSEETKELYDKDGPDLRVGDMVNLGWCEVFEVDGDPDIPYKLRVIERQPIWFSREDLHGLPILRHVRTQTTITGTILEQKVVDGNTIVTMEVESLQ